MQLYLYFRETVKKLANLSELSAKPETSSKTISLSRSIFSPNIFTLLLSVSSVSTSNLNSSSKSPNSLTSFG